MFRWRTQTIAQHTFAIVDYARTNFLDYGGEPHAGLRTLPVVSRADRLHRFVLSTAGLETLSSAGLETLSSVGLETLSSVGLETLSSVGLETLSSVGLETLSSAGLETLSSAGLETCRRA